MQKLEKNFKLFKEEIYEHMLNTRGDKYKWFIRALRLFKYISTSPAKGTCLESYYILMRHIDDIVDGDAPLPKEFRNSEEFILQKIGFAEKQTDPKDKIDYLMLYCFEAGKKFKQDFSPETQDILHSLLFDARRHGTGKVFSEKELQYHFHLLDIRGTISAALKLFDEDPSKHILLKPLGLASRIYYNIRDYGEDIRAGLVNVSAEDCDKFGITNLEDKLSQPVQDWMKNQAEQGLNLIQEHRRNLAGSNFGIRGRLTLTTVYESPAKKYFKQVLQKT